MVVRRGVTPRIRVIRNFTLVMTKFLLICILRGVSTQGWWLGDEIVFGGG